MIENCISSGEKKTVRLCFTSDEAHRCLSVIRQRRRSIVQKKKKNTFNQRVRSPASKTRPRGHKKKMSFNFTSDKSVSQPAWKVSHSWQLG